MHVDHRNCERIDVNMELATLYHWSGPIHLPAPTARNVSELSGSAIRISEEIWSGTRYEPATLHNLTRRWLIFIPFLFLPQCTYRVDTHRALGRQPAGD
jgi:hypothetical protein